MMSFKELSRVTYYCTVHFASAVRVSAVQLLSSQVLPVSLEGPLALGLVPVRI